MIETSCKDVTVKLNIKANFHQQHYQWTLRTYIKRLPKIYNLSNPLILVNVIVVINTSKKTYINTHQPEVSSVVAKAQPRQGTKDLKGI